MAKVQVVIPLAQYNRMKKLLEKQEEDNPVLKMMKCDYAFGMRHTPYIIKDEYTFETNKGARKFLDAHNKELLAEIHNNKHIYKTLIDSLNTADAKWTKAKTEAAIARNDLVAYTESKAALRGKIVFKWIVLNTAITLSVLSLYNHFL